MALLDENTGMMDALGETKLVDTGLEAALQEVFDFQSQHVIEPHARFVKHSDTDETPDERIAFEEALGIFLLEREQLTGAGQYTAVANKEAIAAYRAARRILDNVNMTRQTSRLLRRPYSPMSFNSESLCRGI